MPASRSVERRFWIGGQDGEGGTTASDEEKMTGMGIFDAEDDGGGVDDEADAAFERAVCFEGRRRSGLSQLLTPTTLIPTRIMKRTKPDPKIVAISQKPSAGD